MSGVSVAIFPAHTNFTTKIRTGLLDSGPVDLTSRPTTTTTSTLTSTPTPFFRPQGGRIQTKRMLATVRSGRSWKAQSATRSSSAEDFAVTDWQPKDDVPPSSVMTSSSRSRQRSR